MSTTTNTGKKKINLKNVAKTGGKFTLNAVKFAGKTALTATEIGAKTTGAVARGIGRNHDARKFVASTGAIAANVAFLGPSIGITAINYLFRNCVLGENYSAVDALKTTLGTSEKVLEGVLGIAAEPIELASQEIAAVAKLGKKALSGKDGASR